MKFTELAAQLEGTCYVTRQSVHSVAAIRKAKKAIRKAFENSLQAKGSNLIEIVGTCSSGWKLPPVQANKWMEEHMFDYYHVGDLNDVDILITNQSSMTAPELEKIRAMGILICEC